MGTIDPMPWKASRVVDERVKFIAEVLKGERSITDLCQLYGSLERPDTSGLSVIEAGPAGIEDLSRRPNSCAHETPEAIVKQILELRYKHPTCGARKLRAVLEQVRGDTE